MGFVLDASVTLSWAFADEADAAALAALQRLRDDPALVPSVWWFEVRNVLLVSERRRRITEADTAAFLRALSALSIAVDHAPDDASILLLARRHRLTVYDASYLELALREGLPLATLDRQLAAAARQDGVTLTG